MMSVKRATPDLLKIRVYWNEVDEVITYVHDVATKLYHLIQIILSMWLCDQSLITLAFSWEKLSKPQFYKDLTRKTAFFEEWSWFKFNNLGLTLGTNLKFYTSLSKGLKLKVRVLGANSYVCTNYRGKTGRGSFCPLPPPPSWIGLITGFKKIFKKGAQLVNWIFQSIQPEESTTVFLDEQLMVALDRYTFTLLK